MSSSATIRIGACVLAAAAAASMPPHLPAAERPNVLWIIGEDLGPELACYGTPEVRTPHLDDLAKRGVRFTRAFTTAPVCSASRSAFITGMYQTTIGAHNHRSHRDDGYRLPEGVRIITDRLRDAGYFTANVTDLAQGVKGTGKTDWNFHVAGRPFDSADWDDLKTHQPFYAQVNFPETHRGGAWDSAHQRIPHTADPAKVVIPPYYPDHPVTRNDWAQYLNTVMALDAKVGLVLKKLREDGLADNTVVIFMGDHGRAMVRGKQWCYDSGLRVPLIIYWPEKLEAPQGYDAGRVSGRLIEAIDLTATTLDIAGIEKPPRMQGRVLFGPRADPPREYAFGARDRCDETVFRIRTVRTPRYRYIRNVLPERPFLQQNRYKERQYPVIHLLRMLDKRGELTPAQAFLTAPRRPAEELYDLEHDPWEIHNLAESPEHRKVLTDLRAAVMDWIERTDDQGRFPEPPEVLRKWQDDRKAEDDAAIARRRREVEWQVENQ